MCVAVIVQSSKPISKSYLKAMHEANSDGGGVAWQKDGKVHYRKGLTWEQIHELQDTLPRPFLMHFRIATRGGKIPELTHPFPIGEQAFSPDLSGTTDKGVIIHNGTWSDFKKYIPEGLDLPENKISDTQVAAYMAAIDENILEDVRWSNAIMRPEGTWYRGNWEKHEGNLYSNMHWRRELWRDSDYYTNRPYTPGMYGGYYGRTITPYDTRGKGTPSHQRNHNQEHGKTVDKFPTQFSKNGGVPSHRRGLDTIQSNGKTLKENRDTKRNRRGVKPSERKTQPMLPAVTYEQAVKTYNDTSRISERGKGWEGCEPLFTEDELPKNYGGYTHNNEGQIVKPRVPRTYTPVSQPRTITPNRGDYSADLSKWNGPSVRCPGCCKEITKIPCQTPGCEVTEEDLDNALELKIEALELHELTGMDMNDCYEMAEQNRIEMRKAEYEERQKMLDLIDLEDLAAGEHGIQVAREQREREGECVIGFDEIPDGVPLAFEDETTGPVTRMHQSINEAIARNDNAIARAEARCDSGLYGDHGDVEDMNAYGMGLGCDAVPSGSYLDENWEEIQQTIKDQGIKVKP